jgi:hypothetical protein
MEIRTMGLFSTSTPTAPPPAADNDLAVRQRLLDIAEADLSAAERELAGVRAAVGTSPEDDHSLAVREMSLARTVQRKTAEVIKLRHQAVEARDQGGSLRCQPDGSTQTADGSIRFGPVRVVNPLAGSGMKFGPPTMVRQKMKTVMVDKGPYYMMEEVPDYG